MNLIVGILYPINKCVKHKCNKCNDNKLFIRIYIQKLWENFLSDLIEQCNLKSKKRDRIEVPVYTSKFSEDGDEYDLFEYVIPNKITDYYGMENFKSIVPNGSMIDLISEAI